jgi:hypothetical protein
MDERKPMIRFYYIRDDENKPRVTVCLYQYSDCRSPTRGIALCSPVDNPCKKTGRAIALGRAMKAACRMDRPFPSPPFYGREFRQHKLLEQFNMGACDWDAIPILTDYEKKLMEVT